MTQFDDTVSCDVQSGMDSFGITIATGAVAASCLYGVSSNVLSVAVALFPISALSLIIGISLSSSLMEAMAGLGFLPDGLRQAAGALHAARQHALDFSSLELLTFWLFLLVTYGAAVVLHHLVDTLRLLKLAKRADLSSRQKAGLNPN